MVWTYHGETRGLKNEQMKGHKNIFDEYETWRYALEGNAFEDDNNNHEEPNKQASKYLDNMNDVRPSIYLDNVKVHTIEVCYKFTALENRNRNCVKL